MSYIVIIRMQSDRGTFEQVAAANEDTMRAISERGRAAGARHHGFYADGNGSMVVIDEWDDPQDFQNFFQSESESIGPLMQQAGVQGEPQIEFYERLDTADAF